MLKVNIIKQFSSEKGAIKILGTVVIPNSCLQRNKVNNAVIKVENNPARSLDYAMNGNNFYISIFKCLCNELPVTEYEYYIQ